MQQTTVLITGCAGYIGSLLTQQLCQKSYTVWGVDNLMYGNGMALACCLGCKNFRFLQADVRDPASYQQAIKEANYIVPLAAIVGARACDENHELAYQVNHEAIASLVKALAPKQQLLFPSTQSVYGQNDQVCDESAPVRPISAYGRSKALAEQAVSQHPRATIFRLATAFGVTARPRFDLIVNHLFAELFFQGKVAVPKANPRRNHVHVRDVARVFSDAMLCPWVYGGILNVGHPEANLRLGDLLDQIIGYLGRGRVEQTEAVDTDGRDYAVSSKKLAAGGFLFEFGLEDGFRELEAFCRTTDYSAICKMRYGG